jgi:cyclophilin family peptidyl-prolyl cis-trans isomerase
MKKIIQLFAGLQLFACSAALAQTEVTFYTNQGNFVVELYDQTMPITAGNFASLVNAKFYDGVIFHRVINNFMIQGGDPTGTGSGGPGYTIPDEFVTGISNIQKTISMANSGPNTGGSQFFINLVNNTFLDFDKAPLSSAHPVFGITKSNFNIVQTIGAVPTNSSDRPLTDVVMDSLRITKVGPLSVLSPQAPYSIGEIYPNPVTAHSVLRLQLTEAQKLTLTLIDASGKLCASELFALSSGEIAIPLSSLRIADLPPGNYFIGVGDGVHIMHKKIVIGNR